MRLRCARALHLDSITAHPARHRHRSQDRYLHGGKHGALAEGYSAVLYLSDGGAVSFVDAASKHRVRDIRVEPGRLVVWDNDSLLHAVCPADAAATRFMLGAALSCSRSPALLALVVCACEHGCVCLQIRLCVLASTVVCACEYGCVCLRER